LYKHKNKPIQTDHFHLTAYYIDSKPMNSLDTWKKHTITWISYLLWSYASLRHFKAANTI